MLNETNQVLVIEVLNWRLTNLSNWNNLGQVTSLRLVINTNHDQLRRYKQLLLKRSIGDWLIWTNEPTWVKLRD